MDQRLGQLFSECVGVWVPSNDLLCSRIIAVQRQLVPGRLCDHILGAIAGHVHLFLDQATIVAVAKGSAQVHIRRELVQRLGQLQSTLCAQHIDLDGILKGSVEFNRCCTVEDHINVSADLLQHFFIECEI